MFEMTALVDTTGLNRSINEAAKYTKRTLPEIINTSAYWIAVNAKNTMPFVTAERINTELAVIKHPVIGKRGKPLKNKFTLGGGMVKLKSGKMVPRAALIVMARANPGSNYNKLTNNRYALSKNPFAGVSREAGRAAMRLLVDEMIKSRRKSGHFLVAGWVPAVRKMKPYAVQKFMRGVPTGAPKEYYGGNFGDAMPAIKEDPMPSASIENDIGMEGINQKSFNQALMRYGIPSLQAAITREGVNNMQYALGRMEKEMADQFNRH
jgi:hypothetical protein